MELIRGDPRERRSATSSPSTRPTRAAGPTSRSGSRRPATGCVGGRAPRRLRRDRRREDPLRQRDGPHPDPGRRRRRHADRQPPASSAAAQVMAGEVDDHRRRRDRPAHLPARLHVHRHGRRARRASRAAGAGAARSAGRRSWWARSIRVDERDARSASPMASGSPTTTWSSRPARGSCPRTIEHFAAEAEHFYTAEAALELRQALDAFTGGRIVIGIAGMPYKCPPAPLEVAFLIEAELRERGLREQTELHFCSPIGRAFTIEIGQRDGHADPRAKGHRAPHVLQRRGDRSRAQGGPEPRGRGARLRPARSSCRPTRASSSSSTPGWRPHRAAGCRRTAHTLQVGGRPNVFALGDATDLPLSKAGSTAHFEAPVVTERIVAAIEGRELDRQARRLPRQGDVLLRDRRRQGHAAPVRLRAPAAAAQAEPALAPGQDRVQQDVLAHRSARAAYDMATKTVTARLDGDGLRLIARTGSGHTIVMDNAEGSSGPRPAELLMVALAGCTAMDVASILRKKRQAFCRYEVRVAGEQRDDPPPKSSRRSGSFMSSRRRRGGGGAQSRRAVRDEVLHCLGQSRGGCQRDPSCLRRARRRRRGALRRGRRHRPGESFGVSGHRATAQALTQVETLRRWSLACRAKPHSVRSS